MKLDINCVRDIMLALEDVLTVDDNGSVAPFSTDQLAELLPKYRRGEIIYTTLRLAEAGFLDLYDGSGPSGCLWFYGSGGITYKGHDFIASVRPQPVWLSIGKKAARSRGSLGLNLLASVAEEAAKAFLLGSD